MLTKDFVRKHAKPYTYYYTASFPLHSHETARSEFHVQPTSFSSMHTLLRTGHGRKHISVGFRRFEPASAILLPLYRTLP